MKQIICDMRQGPQRSRRLILLLVGVSAGILLAALLSARCADKSPLLPKDVTLLESGWTDEEGNSVELPVKQTYRPEGRSLERVLPAGDGSLRSLLFYAKYQNARLFWNGEELGRCLCRPEGRDKTRGKVFTLFPLPEESGVLRIETQPLLGDSVLYEISVPQIGSAGALIHGMIADELLGLIITAAIFCFGLFLLICGLQALCTTAQKEDTQTFQASYLHIGLFALMFSLYSLIITDTIHLFVPNSYLIYLMEFLLFMLMPIPLLALAVEVCTARFRMLLTAGCCILFINFTIQTLFHFCLGWELRRGLTVTHLLMTLSALLLFPALVSAGRKQNGRWWSLLAFFPVLVGALADIFRFYLPAFYQKAVGFQLGVLVFLLLQTGYLLRQNLRYYESYLRSGAYRQMAYTDALTGLANRTAFEEKLIEVQEKLESYSSIWCISADINNLKETNDTLGHAAGDGLIRQAAQILCTAVGGEATVYRVGGDEFVLLLFDRSESAARAVRSRLDAALEQYNRCHTLELSIALGCDRFHFSEADTMSRLLSRADGLMYQDKRRWKEAQNRETK
ncbi:sensor domain-containing diguanylate cyclase [Bacilliculturomica massiliensis]|uniref:sensor domain-containing diguanylate cyclase n=1 Tax=Bacilliculturomica massiliensis TaxID=1917867 RepID=UPI00102F7B03|nr:GGDEF domain-containing protein [Bacilliculturomica massiliensis]